MIEAVLSEDSRIRSDGVKAEIGQGYGDGPSGAGLWRADEKPGQSQHAVQWGPAALLQVHLHGLRVHAIGEAACIEYILAELDCGQGGWVITPNLDHLRRLERDNGLYDMYERATLVLADGMPLIWASRIQGTPLPERVAGSTLVSTLSAAAAGRNRSIFLLGGAPGTAAAAGKILCQRYPGLVVTGSHCPEVGFEQDASAMRRLVEALTAARPDIVYVGLGSPKQERLIMELRELLPQAWFLGIGVSFSFLSGDVRRAPVWIQRLGLEWVHRLVQEPRRLAKRYLLEGLPFGVKLLAGAMIARVSGTRNIDGRLRKNR